MLRKGAFFFYDTIIWCPGGARFDLRSRWHFENPLGIIEAGGQLEVKRGEDKNISKLTPTAEHEALERSREEIAQ